MTRATQIILLVVAGVLVVPVAALAYGGPGSAISGVGAFLAAVAALLASLFGFVYFPLKRLYRRITADDPAQEKVICHNADD